MADLSEMMKFVNFVFLVCISS